MTSEEEIKENETLYVKRLNEKIKIDELKNALMALFSQFGDVIMIRARSSLKMRGQAFITFKDINSAKEAKNKLQNVIFLGSPMNISYAKTKCECALVEEGKLTKEEKEQKDLNRKRKRDEYYKAMKESIEAKKANNHNINEDIEMKEQTNEIKVDENAHNILFVDGITKEINEKTIKDLFSEGFDGFKSVKMFASRGMCFVEYDNILDAMKAKQKLDKKQIGNECTLNVTYAKK